MVLAAAVCKCSFLQCDLFPTGSLGRQPTDMGAATAIFWHRGLVRCMRVIYNRDDAALLQAIWKI